MLILGLDFETTGLSSEQDRITEVGAVLWHWETSTPIALLSSLVYPGIPIPAEITKLTGITEEMVSDYGRPESEVFADLRYLHGRSDYVMAHNGTTFDKLFFEAALKRLGWIDTGKPWLDTKIDIRYPEQITTRNLRHLASEHQFLNPFAHRAVFDVLTMLKVASLYPLEEIIARSQEKVIYLRALVSFDDKEKAKARGYYWCGSQKIWWKSLKESDAIVEVRECGFQTAVLDRAPEQS
jgi:DNA polymerase III subunit epsilon